MPRPDYIVCLECQSEVEDFNWREGEIRKATCEVCGNAEPDAFALPEEFEQGYQDDADLEDFEDDEADEYLDDIEELEEDEEH